MRYFGREIIKVIRKENGSTRDNYSSCGLSNEKIREFVEFKFVGSKKTFNSVEEVKRYINKLESRKK